jgi:hypothetical protein
LGTNQVLLIVLGIIIVGVAIIAGTGLMEVGYDNQIKDLAIQHVHVIGGLATKYYRTPKELAGGGGSFSGFKIPENYMNGYLAFDHWLMTRQDLFLLMLNSKIDQYKGKPYRFLAIYRLTGLRTLYLFEPDDGQWIRVFGSTDGDIF